MMSSMITRRFQFGLLPLLLLAFQCNASKPRLIAISPILRAEPLAHPKVEQRGRAQEKPTTPPAKHSDADGRFSEALVPLSALLEGSASPFAKKSGTYKARVGRGKDAFTWVVNPKPNGYFDLVSIESGNAVIEPMHGTKVDGAGDKLEATSFALDGDSLVVTFRDGITTRLTALGKSLRMEVTRPPGPRRGMAAIDLGGVLVRKGSGSITAFRVPYFDIASVAAVAIGREEPHYLTSWFDTGFSNASDLVAHHTGDVGEDGEIRYSQSARYLASDRGQRRTIQERVWLSWSPELTDVLPSMDRPALEGRESFSDYYYLSLSCTPFADATENINALASMGVQDLHVWMKQWQKDGYDNGYPNNVMPPREQWGGMDGMLKLREAIGAAGYAMGMHHNWLFNSEGLTGKSMLSGTGNPLTEAKGGTYLKTSAALEFIDEVEGEIHEAFQTQGTYTDSLAATLPNVDLDGDTEGWGLLRTSLGDLTEVLRRLHTIHGSPIASEGSLGGGNVTWAGLADVMPGAFYIRSDPQGLDQSGKNVEIVPHFALGRIHDISIRAGIGLPARFFMPLRASMLKSYTAGDRDLYQTLTAVYGNAGFCWWYSKTRPGTCARDWWSGMSLFQEFSKPNRELEAILYVDDRGREFDLSAWLQNGGGLNLGDVRLHITWKNGDELWANTTDKAWQPKGRSERIAPYGNLAHAGLVTAAILTTKSGIIQTLEAPNRLFMDGRGVSSTALGITTDGAVGLERVAEAEGGGWHVFPIPEYTYDIPGKGGETLVKLTRVDLDPSLFGEGDLKLTWHNAEGVAGPSEVLPAGTISLSMADFVSRDATSVRIGNAE